MIQIFTALIPVFALIGIGYLFKRLEFPSREFWPLADRFTYYVLMPALLVYKLSAASTPSPQTFNLVYTGLGTILLIFFLLLLLEKLIALDGPAFTSVAQGGIRFNTYVCRRPILPPVSTLIDHSIGANTPDILCRSSSHICQNISLYLCSDYPTLSSVIRSQ